MPSKDAESVPFAAGFAEEIAHPEQAEQEHGHDAGVDLSVPTHVGEPLPNRLGPGELMRALNLPASTFYAFQRAGKFRKFLFRHPIGRKKYAGRLVARYLANEHDG